MFPPPLSDSPVSTRQHIPRSGRDVTSQWECSFPLRSAAARQADMPPISHLNCSSGSPQREVLSCRCPLTLDPHIDRFCGRSQDCGPIFPHRSHCHALALRRGTYHQRLRDLHPGNRRATDHTLIHDLRPFGKRRQGDWPHTLDLGNCDRKDDMGQTGNQQKNCRRRRPGRDSFAK